MANTEKVDVDIHFNSNANQATQDVNQLVTAIGDVSDAQGQATKSIQDHAKALKSNSLAVLENGGAMGLLNDLTGGYAMMIKDVVEASALFTNSKKIDTVATEASTVATGANAVATEAATIATESWTVALLANPVVAITAAVVALGVAVFLVTKYLSGQAEATEKVNDLLKINRLATENLTKANEESKSVIASMNEIEIARAKALGKSTAEIDALIKKQKEGDVQTAISARITAKAATDAASVAIGKVLANTGILGGIDEEALKTAKENYKLALDAEKKANDDVNTAIISQTTTRLGVQERIHNEEVKANEDKNKKILDSNIKAAADAKALADKIAAEKLAADMKSANEALSIVNKLREETETPAEKENREFQDKKTILEANNLSTEELEKQHKNNLLKIQKEATDKELDKIDGTNEVLANDRLTKQETKALEMQDGFDKDRAFAQLQLDTELLDETNRFNALTEAQQQEADQIKLHEDIITNIKANATATRKQISDAEKAETADNIKAIAAGLSTLNQLFSVNDGNSVKSKKKAIIRNGVVNLAQIGVDTGLAISKGYAEGGPWLGSGGAIIATAMGVINTALVIASTNKQLQALGGGSVTSTSPTVASAQPTTTFVSSSNNQIADSISNAQSSTPIKTYVTIGDVNTADELNRKAVGNSTIG